MKKLRGPFTSLLIITMLFGSNLPVKAEGSKELTSNGGNRPYLEWDPTNSSASIPRKNIMKVYVKQGETINLGTSVYSNSENKDIVLRSPSGTETSFDVVKNGKGHIDTIAKESAGPAPNSGGYTPVQKKATEEGIWEVEFHSPASPSGNPTAKKTTEAFPIDGSQGKAVAAWDVTVRDASGAAQKGRLFADYLALNMGSNGVSLNSVLYVLTKDGYQYQTSLNGMDPFGFIFFSNNRGLIDSTNDTTLYHSSKSSTNAMDLFGNVKVQSPFAADNATNMTHRVFINKPSTTLPSSIPTTAVSPSIPENLAFKGKDSRTNIAYEGQGGIFTFTTNRVSSYQLIIDTTGPNGVPDNVYDIESDVVIENVSVNGTNTIVWDGKDKNGNNVPALANNQPYKVKVNLKGGEYHFPLLDVENNPNGFKIQLLNPPYAYPSNMNSTTVFYNDESYKTANGTSVDLSGAGKPNPLNATSGVDSANGAHKFTSSYGDFKGIDTWTYFPGQSVYTDLYITKSKVTGKVFHDLNKNGSLNNGEPGISNILVDIKNSFGDTETVTTDADGNYALNVPEGKVVVKMASDNEKLSSYYLTTNNATQEKTAAFKNDITASPIGYTENEVPVVKDIDPILINKPDKATGKVEASDGDGDHLTYTLKDDPKHGELTLKEDGSWEYEPDTDFAGTDTFEVLVSDGKGGEVSTKISIDVNEKPATKNDQKTITQPADAEGKVEATDANGDNLIYTVVKDAANGNVVLNTDGTWKYQPNSNFAGTDTFEVKVSDGRGGYDIAKITILVNEKPTVENDQKTIVQPEEAKGTIDGTDNDGDALTYAKDKEPTNGSVTLNTDGTWIYKPKTGFVGTDTFKVKVSDGKGGEAISTITIIVRAKPTVSDYSETVTQPNSATGTIVGTDLDGDALIYTKNADPEHGSVTVNEDGTWKYKPETGYVGTDTFKVKVADGKEGEAVSTVTIDVKAKPNENPIIDNYTVNITHPEKAEGKVKGTDPDQDSLGYQLKTEPAHGTAKVNEDGAWEYEPEADFVGTDSFEIKVSDGRGGEAVSLVTIEVNKKPAVNDEQKTVLASEKATGKIDAKDTAGDILTYDAETDASHGTVTLQPDGTWEYEPKQDFVGTDSFKVKVSDGKGGEAISTITVVVKTKPTTENYEESITQPNKATGKVVGKDLDGDSLIFTKHSDPENGTVSVSKDGTWEYTPDAQFTGIDTFEVKVSDEKEGSAISKITIEVKEKPNENPTINDYVDAVALPDKAAGKAIGADPDGDSLSYEKNSEALHGTATVKTDGTWEYQPNADFVGTDSFKIKVSDGKGGEAISTVTIIVRAKPTTENDEKIIFQDEQATGKVEGKDLDHDTLSYEKYKNPSHGTATVKADGTWEYQPDAGYIGTDTFEVKVSDGSEGEAISRITIIINEKPNKVPTVNDYYAATIQPEKTAGKVIGTDLDNDSLSYTLHTAASNGTAAVDSNGVWEYKPKTNFVGTDSFEVLVSDGRGGAAISTVIVTVKAKPTVGNYELKITQPEKVEGKVEGMDLDGDALTYTKDADPKNGTVTVKADGTWEYQPDADFVGTDTFKVKVSDGKEGEAISTVTIVVRAKPTAEDYKASIIQPNKAEGKIKGEDLDGDALTYAKASEPKNGTATVKDDGTWEYQPNKDFVGTDTFKVKVSDGKEGEAISTVTILIRAKPTAEDYKASIIQPEKAEGKVIGTDLDGDVLTYAKAAEPKNGTATVKDDGTWEYQPDKDFVGTDTFKIKVSDEKEGSVVSTVTIFVRAKPTAENDEASIVQPEKASGKVIGNDLDGDTLVYGKESDPKNGTVTVKDDGTWEYQPDADFVGTDTFKVKVSDGKEGEAISTVTIVVRAKPTAENQTVSIVQPNKAAGKIKGEDLDGDALVYKKESEPKNGAVTVKADGTWEYQPDADFVGTDTFKVKVSDGKEGEAISTVTIVVRAKPTAENYKESIIQPDKATGKVAGKDLDGDVLTYTKETGPDNGDVTVKADGTWEYQPNKDFVGTDTFKVKVSDEKEGEAISTVTIVVRAKPTVGNYKESIIQPDKATGKVAGKDLDGDVLTYTKETDPDNGDVTVKADGTWEYQPDADFVGTDTFKVKVSDGKEGSAISAVTIVVSAKPTVGNYKESIIQPNKAEGKVSGKDLDGDALTYAKATDPDNGEVTVKADGTWEYQPDENFVGTDTFKVKVSDEKEGEAISTVTIVVRAKPTAQNYKESIIQPEKAEGKVIGTDLDGDVLTYVKAKDPDNGEGTVKADGTWEYQPDKNFVGTDTFQVKVSDEKEGEAISTVTIVVRAKPTVGNYKESIVQPNKAEGKVIGTDLDEDVLAYAKSSEPQNGKVTVKADGTWEYQPDENFVGTDTFTVKVSDEKEGEAISTVTIVVRAKPTVGNYNTSIIQPEKAAGKVEGSDLDGDALTYAKETDPDNGEVTVKADGTWEYQPDKNFVGTDTFKVKVSDEKEGEAISTVTIVVRAKPTAGNYETTIIQPEKAAGMIEGADLDGDELTYKLQSDAHYGKAAVKADGTWEYQPDVNFVGKDSFEVKVSDEKEGSAISVVTITVRAKPTVENYKESITQPEKAEGRVIGTDLDGDDLTYVKEDDPDNGKLSVKADGTWEYQPNKDFVGTDTFKVKVSDGKEGEAISTITIVVRAKPTVGDYKESIVQPEKAAGKVIGTDLDGDKLTYAKTTDPENGEVTVKADGTWEYEPNKNFVGTDTFQVKVSDEKEGEAISTITIVVRAKPTVGDYKESVVQPEKAEGKVIGTDLDGDTLTYAKVSDPENGEVTVKADGTWEYQPNKDFVGTDTFQVKVSDEKEGEAISTVTIVVRAKPTVGNYNTSIIQPEKATGKVEGSDLDGDALTYAKETDPDNGKVKVKADGTWEYQPNKDFVGTDTFKVKVSDEKEGEATSTVTIIVRAKPTAGNYETTIIQPEKAAGIIEGADLDGDELTYKLHSDAFHGKAAVKADGTWEYQPEANFVGKDSFEVKVSDEKEGEVISTVTVVVRAKPTVGNYKESIIQPEKATGRVIGKDLDGDTLTYAKVSDPDNGEVTMKADGTWEYQPEKDFVGTDTFKVKVSDEKEGEAISTVTIVVRAKPTVENYKESIIQPEKAKGKVIGTDLDGDKLTYAKSSDPENGEATLKADGTWEYEPNKDFVGTDTFQVKVSDEKEGEAISTITIVVRAKPTAGNYKESIIQPEKAKGKVIGTDLDGDKLTYAKETDPDNGKVTVKADGTWEYQPNKDFVGTDTFKVKVSDEKEGEAISTVTIVVRAKPTVENYNTSIIQPEKATGEVKGSDLDGDALTYEKETNPNNGEVKVKADGTWEYEPNKDFVGTDTFTVKVSDEKEGEAISTVTIVVRAKPTAGNYETTIIQPEKAAGTIKGADLDGDELIYKLHSDALHGKVEITADGTWEYRPDANFVGKDSFEVKVSDEKEGEAISVVTITVRAKPTVENYKQSIIQPEKATGRVIGTDLDGDALTYAKATNPEDGKVTVKADGTWEYQPDKNFVGTDTFKVKVSDEKEGEAISTVTVVVRAKPTTENYKESIIQPEKAKGKVIGTDLDGDKLTYAKETDPDNGEVTVKADGAWEYQPEKDFVGTDTFQVKVSDEKEGEVISTVTIVVRAKPTAGNYKESTIQPEKASGKVIGTDLDGDKLIYAKETDPDNGEVTVKADGTWEYQPEKDFVGTDTFKVKVSDEKEGEAISTITIVVRAKPTVNDNYRINMVQPEKATGKITGTDLDGDTLSYELNQTASHGSVIVKKDGTWEYEPEKYFVGMDTFKVKVSDGKEGEATSTVTIVVRAKPTVGNYNTSIIQPEKAEGKVTGTDLDGDVLTYAKASDPENGEVTVKADGTWEYHPAKDFVGTDMFKVRVSDSKEGEAISTVTIVVRAKPMVGDYKESIVQPEKAVGKVTGTDLDGDTLTYAKASNPENGDVIVKADGTWEYQPEKDFVGTDTFKVKVSDGKEGEVISTVTIVVRAKPTVGDYNTSIIQPEKATGKVAGSDLDGDALTYAKETDPDNGEVTVKANGTWEYQPEKDFVGTDTFKVKVSDGKEGEAISTVTIVVRAKPTVGDYNTSIIQPEKAAGKVTGTDLDGDALIYAKASDSDNGEVTVKADGTWEYQPEKDFVGTDTFKVKVSDEKEGIATSTITVVVRAKPTAGSYETTIIQPEKAAGTIKGADLDGDELTYKLHSDALHGEVTVKADGTWEYHPGANFVGKDSFEVKVSDGKEGEAISVVTITVRAKPTMEDDKEGITITQPEKAIGRVTGTDLDGDILTYAKATDPDNGEVTVKADGTWEYQPEKDFVGTDTFKVKVSDGKEGEAISTVTIVVRAKPTAENYKESIIQPEKAKGKVIGTDLDGDKLTYAKETDPDNGEVTVKVDGTWEYQPEKDFVGTDTFKVKVSDGKEGEAISTITIVVRAKPTVGDYKESIVQPEKAAGKVIGTDLDGDKLTYAKTTDPDNGEVTVKADGTWEYEPNKNFVGTDTFKVKVSDEKEGEATSTVTIVVRAKPTVEDNKEDITITQPEKATGRVIGKDLDGDTLTYAKETDPDNGEVKVKADGTWEYQPEKGFVGTDTFKVKVSDGKEGEAISTVTIVVRAKPTAENYKESIIQPEKAKGKVTGADLDGDTLTYAKATDPDNGEVKVKADGTWEYQPNKDFVGTDTFKVKVSDGKEGEAISTVTIVVRAKPTAENYKESIIQPEKAKGKVTGADLDGDTLTYAKAADPDNGEVKVKADGTWEYQPEKGFVGTDTFKVKVSDGKEGEAISTVTVVVTAIPSVGDYDETVTQPNKAAGKVVGSDLDGDNLTYQLLEGPKHGTVTVKNNGAWEYQPDVFYEGKDQFTVTVSDSEGNKAESTVNITVKEAPPSKEYDVALTAAPSSIIGDGRSTSAVEVTVTDSSDQVVKGAEVSVDATKGNFAKSTGITDENGEITFTYTAPSNTQLEEIKATITAHVVIPSTKEQVKETTVITILPARVEGIVTDGRTNKVIPNASVSLREDFDKDGTIDYTANTVTDKFGKYSILVPKGNYVYHPIIKTELEVNGTKIPFEYTQSVTVGDLSGKGDNFYSEKKATGTFLVYDETNNKVTQANDYFSNGKFTAEVLNENDAEVSILENGEFELTNIQKNKEYKVAVNVIAPNGEKLAGKLITIKVGEDGELSINPELIDPYGIITDKETNEALKDVKVSLYWADTALNKEQNRKPNTLVKLPELPYFAPANNKVPQITGENGAYAWMVYPEGDYYIKAEKDGYAIFDSRNDTRQESLGDSYVKEGIIHVGQTIVSFDFQMSKKQKANTDTEVPSVEPNHPAEDKETPSATPNEPEDQKEAVQVKDDGKDKGSEEKEETAKEEPKNTSLPKTGGFFDISLLYAAGLILLLSGIFLNIYLRRRMKK